MDRQKQLFLNLKDESKYFVDRTRLSIYTQDLFSWVCFPAISLSSTLSLCIIIPCEPCCCFTFTHQSLIPALPIQHDVWRSFSGLDSYSIYNSSSEVWIYIVLIRLLAWYMALCFLMITHNWMITGMKYRWRNSLAEKRCDEKPYGSWQGAAQHVVGFKEILWYFRILF